MRRLRYEFLSIAKGNDYRKGNINLQREVGAI